ncbi:Mitochondrial ATPase complex subunit atp10 [Pseudogymnoascus destructans]|uniref:Mitochondrial ATPase complex subunit atp10 n=2 Tax=Pseudogymnoascus destructans TaxID=655981 RepID=L8G8D7_PSED2|nr:Mitochondrial ATPase complex subunit atp10 [Pseudogymnoascus destructans]ELR09362.1 hypothetical protein GMDG_03928 [Pseudogymnoascus destructans 20631-21]OAF61049.1 Mitochondrial ATPase complex subunit atp10 [Pseudogymnoascus destructans]
MNATKAPLARALLHPERFASIVQPIRSEPLSTTLRRYADKPTPPTSAPALAPAPEDPKPVSAADLPSPLADAPRATGKAVEQFTPKPLPRPIGLPRPPRAGENAGVDTRSWKQRRDDFVDYDKHIVKRKILTERMATPYFREWSNMRHHKGKSFVAPPRLFRAERALYFPNLQGQTLLKDAEVRDTTPVLSDKISIVSVFSSAWAEHQATSFVGKKENAELHEVVAASGGRAQMVQINVEENPLKAALIKLFKPSLRAKLGRDAWGKYFVVTRGLTGEMRDAMGLLNSKVGYTYLLDGACRVRWAGSGIAEGDEREGLVRGVRKLIEEAKGKKGSPGGTKSAI